MKELDLIVNLSVIIGIVGVVKVVVQVKLLKCNHK